MALFIAVLPFPVTASNTHSSGVFTPFWVVAEQQRQQKLDRQNLSLGRVASVERLQTWTQKVREDTLTEQRDQLQTQLALVTSQKDQLQSQKDQLQAQVTALQAQLATMNGGAGSGPAAPVSAGTSVSLAVGRGASGNHFAFGYCTAYVADLWYRATGVWIPWMGNAIAWYGGAMAYGWPVGRQPRTGAIMVTAESIWGHVAFVTSVGPTSYTVTEMNYVGWNQVDSRTIPLNGPAAIIGFIY
jgi:surface antigen